MSDYFIIILSINLISKCMISVSKVRQKNINRECRTQIEMKIGDVKLNGYIGVGINLCDF